MLFLEQNPVEMIDYESSLFNIDISGPAPVEGSLLISEPFLRDAYFRHSVVLLAQYKHETTSMGVILNHPTSYDLHDLVEGINVEASIPVRCGGPMSDDRLYFVHRLGDIIPNSRHVADDLYIGGDFDAVIQYINSGYPLNGFLAFFVGYSGWSEGQLDQELSDKVWAVATTTSPEEILSMSYRSMWHKQVRRLGPKYRGWLYHPRIPLSN